MILFLEDWKRYPGAAPDYSTSNKSWVRLAGVYHNMGVENCLFHLALHNQNLKKIDPHSEDLTESDITMIVDECAENPWYFLREVLKIPPIAGVNPLQLRANRGNISLYWLFFNHVTTMLIQPRQTGKSVSVDALMVGLLVVLSVHTSISLLTKDDALRVRNIQRLKDIMSHLPWYFQLKSKKDSNNTEKITLERLNNIYQTAVAQSSVKAALKIGRGMTNPINHVDEISFVNNIGITLPAFLAAGGAARDEAAAVNAPYGNLFTTTPGYLASDSGKYAYGLYNDCFRWSEKMFDVLDEPTLFEQIRKNSPSGKAMVLLDYNHRQLGYTDDWLREKIAESMANGQAAEADFLGIWPEGSGSTLISKEVMKVIVNNRVQESETDISTYGYIIKWYVPKHVRDNMLLIAGLDTSEAIGKDGIGLIIRDVATGAVVGSGDFNETNTVTFARWLCEFLVDNPTVLLIIERKNTGVSIIDAMLEILVSKGIDPFARLFNWVVNDVRSKPAFDKDVVSVPFNRRDPSVYVKYRKYFGYTTTGAGRSSRDMLYGEIFNASITYTADTVRDPKLINQLQGLVVKNNRIDHSTGSNDDLVIAWLLAYWVLSKAENVEFYGIPVHKVLTHVTEAIIEEQGGSEAIMAREYQLELKAEIDDLVDLIKQERSPIRTKMLLNRLRYLYKDIDTSVIQSFSIDGLIDSLELEKKRNLRRY